MTVVEKLENNVAEVNSAFQNIKSKIASHGVEVGAELRPSEYASKVDAVYEAGKQAQYDEFWDAYQQNGTRTDYNDSFRSVGWTKNTFKPKYDIRAKKANGLFSYSKIEQIDVVVDVSGAGSITSTFSNCPLLHTIKKIVIDETLTFSSVFYNCPALVNLTIEGTIGKNGFSVQQSTKLSKASITSIINALSSTTSELTVTLSKTAVNKAFETSAGAGDGSTSAEWQSLIAPKSNWTISLI